MSLWDRLFPRSTSTPQAPAQTELEWKNAPQYLDERHAAWIKPKIPQAESLMREISGGYAELAAQVGTLFTKPLQTEQRNILGIAKQMRENYVKRAVQATQTVKVVQKAGYEETSAFHRQSLAALQTLDKTAFDNRYLVGFYTKDFERLGEIVKPLARNIDDLGKWLQENRQTETDFDQAQKAWKDGENALAQEAEWKRKAALMGKEIEDAKGIFSQEKDLAADAEKTRARAVDAETALSAAKTRAIGPIAPLSRLLRKYAHETKDKKKAAAAGQYSTDAYGALCNDSELESLKGICAEALALIAQGALQAESGQRNALENLAKALQTGEIQGMADKTKELAKELRDCTEMEKKAREKIAGLESAKAKNRIAQKAAAEAQEKAGAEHAAFESSAANLEAAAAKATGAQVRIAATDRAAPVQSQ
ncbi:MAG: hypothetical protein V1708_03720 [Candidatus Micrarchaeota archaeon]